MLVHKRLCDLACPPLWGQLSLAGWAQTLDFSLLHGTHGDMSLAPGPLLASLLPDLHMAVPFTVW